ncbi:hypothetical protein [Acinetobacter baumannii]|uniref:hypothetical protein n=1 Tax=Acinetobacter baumannii TaxID=470 RepID=UPI00193DEC85|nr:hypothetical protein [Acinetobacter baumannii]QRN23759.1 hypothetical protein H0H24_09685 [Acinetobacter baumannii]
MADIRNTCLGRITRTCNMIRIDEITQPMDMRAGGAWLRWESLWLHQTALYLPVL